MRPSTLLYACGDAVNRRLVRRWLDRRGVALADEPPADACLVALDHLPHALSLKAAVQLLKTFDGRPRGVHGYQVPRELTRWRRRHGVLVHRRRITARFIDGLLASTPPAAPPAEAAVASGAPTS